MTQGSIVALGLSLFIAVVVQVLLETDQLVTDLFEVVLPLMTAIGFIIAGIWLRTTCSAERIRHLALWTISGAVLGVAINFWFVFIISLEDTLTGDFVVLNLNGAAIFMALCLLLGYYVTGLRQREQDLEQSEARFRALTEHSPFGVVTIDETSTIRYANDGVADLTGYSTSELVGESLTMLMPERFRDDHRTGLNNYLSSGDRTLDWSAVELNAQHADGDEFPIQVSFGEYQTGEARLFTGVIQDISDRKAAEAQVREHAEKVTRLHELATELTGAEKTDAIFQRTVDGAVDLFDGDVARISVIENDQLVPIASSGEELLDECDPLSISAGYAGASYRSDDVVRVADLTDTRSTTSASGTINSNSPMSQEVGETQVLEEPVYRGLLSIPISGVGVVQVFATEADAFSERDEEVADLLATHVRTTYDRLETEAVLRRERDRLDEFASVLSHDIRNPLNVAQARLEMVRDASEPEEHLDAIDRSLGRIQQLVEDVLTLAQEGKAVGETESVALDRVVEKAWGNVATENATLQTESLSDIEADRSRLVQVLENLYRNAIEHGGSDVTVTVGQMNDGFYVEDTGPGIPEEERDEVFEHGYSTSADGTGYGLTIVKRIVDAHDWKIVVTNGTDGGARFEISDVDISD